VWFVKMFLILVVFVAVMGFAIMNLREHVTVQLYPGRTGIYDVQMVVALFVAFVGGMFTWFVASLARELRIRREIGRMRRQLRQLEQELTALRNLPLEDVRTETPE
jgi:uncharacterized integral membrane protein